MTSRSVRPPPPTRRTCSSFWNPRRRGPGRREPRRLRAASVPSMHARVPGRMCLAIRVGRIWPPALRAHDRRRGGPARHVVGLDPEHDAGAVAVAVGDAIRGRVAERRRRASGRCSRRYWRGGPGTNRTPLWRAPRVPHARSRLGRGRRDAETLPSDDPAAGAAGAAASRAAERGWSDVSQRHQNRHAVQRIARGSRRPGRPMGMTTNRLSIGAQSNWIPACERSRAGRRLARTIPGPEVRAVCRTRRQSGSSTTARSVVRRRFNTVRTRSCHGYRQAAISRIGLGATGCGLAIRRTWGRRPARPRCRPRGPSRVGRAGVG